MPDIRIIRGIQIMPEANTSLLLAGYREHTAAWIAGEKLFAELQPVLRRVIQPRAAVAFAADGREHCGLYVVLTLGNAVMRQADRYSSAHEFTRDLLFRAMADTCLFALEKQVLQQLPVICREKGVGISGRHEGGTDVPLAMQKEAVEIAEAERTLGVTVNSEYMLVPEKSMCLIFDTCPDPSVFHTQHDCSQCQKQDCILRQQEMDEEIRCTCPPGQPILSFLQEQHMSPPALCGGRGNCGKCRVRILSGHLPVTAEDMLFFSSQELADGWRLACRAVPSEAVIVSFARQDESSFAVLGMTGQTDTLPAGHQAGIAIDIGTTTLAVSLVDITAQRVVHTETAVNSQRRFGADVISRIQAANTGCSEALRQDMVQDICRLAAALHDRFPCMDAAFAGFAAAGNTTMQHLLMGYSCRHLGTWPFTPVSLGGETISACEVLGSELPAAWKDAPFYLLPGISTYVGADITAGIWHCGMSRQSGLSLLLDLGTNGEMALGNKEHILVASASAGPALEGGNLSCGTGSVRGAVSHVTIRDGRAFVQTIGQASPVGICGTGIIACMAGLLEQGIADETGKLQEPYFSSGFPVTQKADGTMLYLTQQDIREIQMAKGAIRAGVETLLRAYGAIYEDIQHIYLAGGFGVHLQPAAAAVIGLLPDAAVSRVTAAGNTALAGAADVLIQPQVVQELEHIQKSAKEIILGNTPEFQKLYISHMGFKGEHTG